MVLELRQIALALDERPVGAELTPDGIISNLSHSLTSLGRHETYFTDFKNRLALAVPAYLEIISNAQLGERLTHEDFQNTTLYDKTSEESANAKIVIDKIAAFSRVYVSDIVAITIADRTLPEKVIKKDYPTALHHFESEQQAAILLHMLHAHWGAGVSLDERYQPALKRLKTQCLVDEDQNKFALTERGIIDTYRYVSEYYARLDQEFMGILQEL